MNASASLIDFWFDFASPYGYLMSEKIEAVVAHHGRTIRWRPVLLFAVLRALDLPAPLGPAVKRDYVLSDAERSARHLGVPYALPDGFPAPTQHAARAFYLIEQSDPVAAVHFAHAVYRGYFQRAADIGDPALIAAWAAAEAPALGDAAAVLAQLQSAPTKALLAGAVDAAVQRRVFGSPFVVVDGEAFFGVDRLPQIEALLAGALAAAPHSSKA